VAAGETTSVVLADTSVIVNLAIVERLDLLRALPYAFRVPDEVIDEVRRPEQCRLVAEALDAGYVERVQVTGIAVLEHFRDLRHHLGPGEAACLALASARAWKVACDEKRWFRREALRLLGEGGLIDTPGLFLLAIRRGYWTASDADRAKEVLERNRFRMRFRSFHDLVRRESS
jgi:predicted nucleic acid-binding protein